MATFSFSLVYAFQKQVQSILEVYFITKFLMDSKYTLNKNLNYISVSQTLEIKISPKF